MRMSLPFLITTVKNAEPSNSRTHATIDRPDAGDLAHLAVDRAAAHERPVVDQDVHRRVRSRRGGADRVRGLGEHEPGERIGRIGLERLVLTVGAPGPEDPLRSPRRTSRSSARRPRA